MSQYQPTEQECRFCGEEAVVNGPIDSYCTNCYATTTGHDSQKSHGVWEDFRNERERYPRSNIIICIGGFLDKYDWNQTDSGIRY